MIKPLGILIICLFIVIVGGILVWQFWSGGEILSPKPPVSTSTPTSTPPIDETTSWKIYEHKERGYEVSCPVNVVVDENPEEKTLGAVKFYFPQPADLQNECFIGFDENLKRFQDWDLWKRMLDKGYEGVWIPERLFSGPIQSRGISNYSLKNIIKIIKRQLFG